MLPFAVNGKKYTLEVEPDMPLLWVLRDILKLRGAKYGCGIGLCGACTVHVEGEAVRACMIPVSAVGGKSVTTIEGLSPAVGQAVQQAWRELDVPQCGYCQPGMIMSAVALLRKKPSPSDADIDAAMTNICRCGTYSRVRRAIQLAARLQGGTSDA